MSTSQPRWPLWPWAVLTAAGVVITAVAAVVGTATRNDTGGEQLPTRITVTATQLVTTTINVTITVAPPPDHPAGGGVIDNGVINGPGTLTINANELVETAGCQPWQKVG